MNKEIVSKQFAKSVVLNAQLLDNSKITGDDKQATLNILNQLGYVQIDTLAVVKRAHHHIIWTRDEKYKENYLDELLSVDRSIYEYWGHAMSYLPMSDFRFSLPRMKKFLNPSHKWIKQNMEVSAHLFDSVLERIKNEGPLSSKDFRHEKDEKRGSWWDWKPAKMALEILFWQGKLMVSERRNFQKYYDLTERVLPTGIDTSLPGEEETGRFLVNRALGSMGIATEKEIGKFLQPAAARDSDFSLINQHAIKSTLQNMLESGEITNVGIESINGVKFFIKSSILKNKKKQKENSHDIYILSPFDNLLIQRERTKQLFDFDYAIECYLPEHKRKYGYFVMPVLWGDQFIARFDAKADQASKTFFVKNIVFEETFAEYEEALPLLATKLKSFAEFNNCAKISIMKMNPTKYKSVLNRLVKQYN